MTTTVATERRPRNRRRLLRGGVLHAVSIIVGAAVVVPIAFGVLGGFKDNGQLFDMVWVLTAGGPIRSSETLAVTMFQEGFKRFHVGYASAISMAIFLISLTFGLLYQRFVMRRDLEGAITNMGDQR